MGMLLHSNGRLQISTVADRLSMFVTCGRIPWMAPTVCTFLCVSIFVTLATVTFGLPMLSCFWNAMYNNKFEAVILKNFYINLYKNVRRHIPGDSNIWCRAIGRQEIERYLPDIRPEQRRSGCASHQLPFPTWRQVAPRSLQCDMTNNMAAFAEQCSAVCCHSVRLRV
jgi:hypothetical protein